MGQQSRHTGQAGQAMVIMAISVAVILAATAVVLDGGNAMAQQRGAQNATDSAALAGAVVIGQNFAACRTLPCNSRSDADVLNAVRNAFDNNATAMGTAHYVDFTRNQLGMVGAGGSIPSAASGVQIHGTRSFSTYLANLIGQPTWTAGADATALAGEWLGGCSAADGCGTLPVVFSIPIITCDGTNRPLRVGGVYTSIGDPSLATSSNESIVPLCKTGPGGVGWIDMPGCTGNLSNQIWPPCSSGFRLPTWLHTSSGDSNNVENVINTNYAGTIVLIPMFDATCREIPDSRLPGDCPLGDTGNGDNLYYHIPVVAPFLLDRAYIQGNNHPQCDSDPGGPHVGGNGSTGCFKGWFVNEMLRGEVGAFTPCDTTDDSTTCAPPIIGTQLVQ